IGRATSVVKLHLGSRARRRLHVIMPQSVVYSIAHTPSRPLGPGQALADCGPPLRPYRRRRGRPGGDRVCLPRGDLYLAHYIRADDPMSDIESPCNKVCAVDPISALCIGCGRNLAEIEGWMRMGAHERARIMAPLPRRLAALGQRHTARAG